MQAEAGLPSGFKYRAAYLSGRPRHAPYDVFSLKHPAMNHGQRAKIFAPFDALKGFSEAVAAKEVPYESFREPDPDRLEALNRKITLLRPLVASRRAARENRVILEVEYFVPCEDPDNEAFGILGQYRRLTGMLWAVDPVRWHLMLDNRRIDMDDIFDIRDPEGKWFSEEGMPASAGAVRWT